MTEQKTGNRGKILILLALSLVIQSLSSVFIKYAGMYETMSYLRKGILYILILFWSVLLFKEQITINNIIGSIIIIVGISLHGMDEH